MKNYKYFLPALTLFIIFTYPAVADDLLLSGQLEGDYWCTGYVNTQGTTTVEPSTTANVSGYFTITLKLGFHAKEGSNFHASIPDDDGLSNLCEMTYFGDIFLYGPDDDPDGDRVTNFYECYFGFSPTEYVLDNDADGLEDWWEIEYFGLNLGYGGDDDPDGDNVLNRIEFTLGSNPSEDDLPGPGIHYEYDELGRIKKIWRIPAE